VTDAEIEVRIRDFFDANYRQILAEGGAHILTPQALEQARQQVEHYWKKLREIAVNVTETEVRLQLPNQKTPKGRKFVIEGVVDLVKEADRIRMYDIKTHYCEEVRHHQEQYVAQLNVYAYVWKHLRGREIHDMGIIAVQLPQKLREAIRSGRQAEIARELELWNPLVPIPPEPSSIAETFDRIASTVDLIEDGTFSPRSPEELAAVAGADQNSGGERIAFATLHCRNCDGRFSCSSYREYMRSSDGTGRRFDLLRYIDAASDDGELDEWIDGNIELDLEDVGAE
jgi:hypothetical protein